MLNNKKLPVEVQDFERLRKEDYAYVDKTEYVYQLTRTNYPYFLGRPRRFGKSLLLSTLKAYFLGKKELFEGLAIAELEKDWIEYPVLYIDLNVGNYVDPTSLHAALDTNLKSLELQWGKDEIEKTPALRLYGLIDHVRKQAGRRVVVLIDEFDKPLVSTFDNSDLHQYFRDILRGFYGVLKSADANLHFVFLTGITKFPQVSIFSDVNHLVNISLNKEFAGICGISETELIQNFQPEIKALAEANKLSYEEAFAKLKKHYNGYHFAKESEDIYNPYSVLKTFYHKNISDYWYKTGTSAFLVKVLKKCEFRIPNLENSVDIDVNSIMDYRGEDYNPTPLLYQSGYLTIKEYCREYNEYTLGFPNEEVKYSFLDDLLPAYVPQYGLQPEFSTASFVRALCAGDVDGFMNTLKAFYASIPCDLMNRKDKDEQYYQYVFYILVTLMGQFVQAEVKTSAGRADAVIKTEDTIYAIEFKMGNRGIAEEALKQIDEKGYLIPFTTDGRKLVKIGAEFNDKDRGLSRWIYG
jgi:hypothetical protein